LNEKLKNKKNVKSKKVEPTHVQLGC